MIDQLDFLLDSPPPAKSSFRWATVTSTNPVRLRFDGDTAPTPATPTSTVAVVTGDRVWVQIHGRMMIIIGRLQTSTGASGGGPFAMAAGAVTVPVGGSWNTVNFPAGRFTQPPVVTATVSDGNGSSQGVLTRLGSGITASQFTIHLVDLVGTAATEARINWIAVQVDA